MKKIVIIITIGVFFCCIYCVFLKIFPLSKRIFYSNDERSEEYIYMKSDVPIVMVGSSLIRGFEGARFFKKPFYDLFLDASGSCTGIEMIRRSGKVPEILFVEINHIDRGIDTILIKNIFNSPISSFKPFMPFLLKKNKFLNNLVDHIKKPVLNELNNTPPPARLYSSLITSSIKAWSKLPDSAYLFSQIEQVKDNLNYLNSKGTKICFFEVPMDTCLFNSKAIKFQRSYFKSWAIKKGYGFIGYDKFIVYKTGDGIHMLKSDFAIYTKYFLSKVSLPKSDFLNK